MSEKENQLTHLEAQLLAAAQAKLEKALRNAFMESQNILSKALGVRREEMTYAEAKACTDYIASVMRVGSRYYAGDWAEVDVGSQKIPDCLARLLLKQASTELTDIVRMLDELRNP